MIRDWMIWLDNHEATGTAIALVMMVFFFALAALVRWRQDRREREKTNGNQRIGHI